MAAARGKEVDDATPVIVGVGRMTQRTIDISTALDPIGLMAAACRRAAVDASGEPCASGDDVLRHIDACATVNMLMENRVPKAQRPLYPNPARSVADAVSATGCTRFFQTTSGGQSPQLAINELATRIADGELQSAIVVGAEGLATFARAMKMGYKLQDKGERPSRKTDAAAATTTISTSSSSHPSSRDDDRVLRWGDNPDGPPAETLGYSMEWPLVSIPESIHGINTPTTIYALFEQAIRKGLGRSNEEHMQKISELFAGFSSVAARDPHNAWCGDQTLPTPAPHATLLFSLRFRNREVFFLQKKSP